MRGIRAPFDKQLDHHSPRCTMGGREQRRFTLCVGAIDVGARI
jgi:hypothetical protein